MSETPLTNENFEKPCLVNAKQGFTVFYKNKFLYSKYNPSATAEKTIENTQIEKATLVIATSPVLFYGMESLLEKIDEKSFVLAVESDKNLFDFTIDTLQIKSHSNFMFLNISDDEKIEKLFFGNEAQQLFFQKAIRECKHVLKIDMSAVDESQKIFYERLCKFAMLYIQQFWKNRMTITKLGKLYSKNILKNLPFLEKSKKLQNCTIEKPIFVFGAGTSVDDFFENLKTYTKNSIEQDFIFLQKNFFIIAVDHALKPLLERKITPNIVVTVESQLANEKAFIGINNEEFCKSENGFCLVSDLTARTNIIEYVLKNPQNTLSFVFTEFAQMNFLDTLKPILSNTLYMPPMGSVGLYAMNLALFLRKENVPIFFTGLDFSFPSGKTHCKNAPALFKMLSESTRIKSAINVGANYAYGLKCISGPQQGSTSGTKATGEESVTAQTAQNSMSDAKSATGTSWFTSPALDGYAKDFIRRFSNEKNIFNLSMIKLGAIQSIDEKEFKNLVANLCNVGRESNFDARHNLDSEHNLNTEHNLHTGHNLDRLNKQSKRTAIGFLENEIHELEKIKNALVNGGMTTSELCKKIEEHDYLYIHFPDGNADCHEDISFLKRVRAEIDYFLKVLKTAIASNNCDC